MDYYAYIASKFLFHAVEMLLIVIQKQERVEIKCTQHTPKKRKKKKTRQNRNNETNITFVRDDEMILVSFFIHSLVFSQM